MDGVLSYSLVFSRRSRRHDHGRAFFPTQIQPRAANRKVQAAMRLGNQHLARLVDELGKTTTA